jgi:hypothetical protein
VDSASETVVVGGGHDATGTDVQPLDAKALRAAVARSERSSFAVSARFGARNPEHEVLASNIILELRPEVTVVSGSDLAGVDECGLPVQGLNETIEEVIRLRLLRAITSALTGKALSEEGEANALLKGTAPSARC